MSLERVDDVEGGDGLSLGVLSVGDGVADDRLQEGLENTAGLLVDHGRDTLDTTTASETADSGLGDTLDVVTKNLPVTLGSALAETLATFAAWRARQYVVMRERWKDNVGFGRYSRPVIVMRCGVGSSESGRGAGVCRWRVVVGCEMVVMGGRMRACSVFR